MKTCKLRPEHNTCRSCLDIQVNNHIFIDCEKCKEHNATYTLLQIGTSFWSGDYAFVERRGVIKKVALSRVYGVKEVKE